MIASKLMHVKFLYMTVFYSVTTVNIGGDGTDHEGGQALYNKTSFVQYCYYYRNYYAKG